MMFGTYKQALVNDAKTQPGSKFMKWVRVSIIGYSHPSVDNRMVSKKSEYFTETLNLSNFPTYGRTPTRTENLIDVNVESIGGKKITL
jgi:hypothetical protein